MGWRGNWRNHQVNRVENIPPEDWWSSHEKIELEWEATPDYETLIAMGDGTEVLVNGQDEEDLWDMGYDGPDPDIAYDQMREAREWGI